MLFAKLLPRDENFFRLFDAHAGRMTEAARAFMALIDNYADEQLRGRYAAEVDAAERAADKVTAEVSRLLHKTFITPIDREQIHSLINAMDDIVDLLQDVTETMSLYDIRALTSEVRSLGQISVRSCEREVGEAALKSCQEIDLLESDADRVMRAAMSKLFREQADVRELIKLKTVYELLESITDRCEDVANLIEGIVLENA
jgi:uncharacterized protein Yka (UPF0111/DUF47 family)